MNYGKKPKGFGKGSGKGLGGGGYRSGYLAAKDPLAAYRQPSAPMDEYSRKLRHRLEKPEVSMSGNFSPDTSSYRPKTITQTERTLSQKQVDELSEQFLEKAIDEFKKITGETEISQEKYEVMHDTADKVTQRMEEIQNNPDDNTTVVDFAKEFLEKRESSEWDSDILERVDEIRNQPEQMKTDALEIRDSLPEMEKFADDMKRYNDLYGNVGVPAEPKIEYEIPDLQYDFNQTRKRKSDLGYESEFDAV